MQKFKQTSHNNKRRKRAVSILGNEIVENDVEKNLNIKDLTGAGDLFAEAFYGYLNNLSNLESLNKGKEMSSSYSTNWARL